MENRRLVIAVALSFLVLVVWTYLFPAAKPSTKPPAPAEEEAPLPATPSPAPPSRATPTADAAPPAEVAAGLEPIEAAREEHPVVETDRIRVELTNKGGEILSFQLKQHSGAQHEPLDLVRTRAGAPFPFSATTLEGRPLPLEGALFDVERVEGEAGETTVAFRYSGPLGTAEKRFHFRPDGLFDVDLRVSGAKDWAVLLGPGVRNPSAVELESRYQRHGAVYRVGDDVKVLYPQKANEAATVAGAGLRWVGLEDTFFLTALMPAAPVREAVVLPVLLEPTAEGIRFPPVPPKDELTSEQKDLPRDFLVLVQPMGDRLEATAFWGAKQYDRLAALPYGLEKTVQLGMFGFFARGLMVGLQWIHQHVIHNYGWGIVLMTVLIKLVLLPLTHRSFMSMRKMQELNPKIQAIRDRYRGKLRDKKGRPDLEVQRKMNDEIMALYRSEGVNPAGGCLPMVLQLPVLWAFYNLLIASVELRNAPWILWIHDLTAADPYYVLPIVMGVTQFLQQRMTPFTGNPTQRRVMMLMPLFFTILFLKFPSGLVLYWLTNNVLSIAQQSVYNRLRDGAPSGRGAEPKRIGKR